MNKILGIDLGSRAVKLVIFENGKIINRMLFDTANFYKTYCTNNNGMLEVDFNRLELGGFDKVVSTGYGRNNVNILGALVIQELKAHAYGALWQTKLTDFTLLDVGGQDSKVISIKNSKIVDIALNDKCAASCGRYLENMATLLGVNMDEMGMHFENPIELNSTCAVFSESELIGRISEGIEMNKLIAGVNYSLFKKIGPFLGRFAKETLVVTGGVAQNKALINIIKKELTFDRVILPEDTRFNGAIGCCVYSFVKKSSKMKKFIYF